MFIFRSKIYTSVVSLFFALVILFANAGQVFAYTIDAHWLDRAHIQIDKMLIDDRDQQANGFSISNDTSDFVSSQGSDAVANAVNAENGNNNQLFDNDILDSRFEYIRQNCKYSNETIDLKSTEDLNAGKANLLLRFIAWNANVTGAAFNGCHQFSNDIAPTIPFNITDPNNAKDIWFTANDDLSELTKVDQSDGPFTRRASDNNPNIYYAKSGGNNCGSGDNFGKVIIDAGSVGQPIMTGNYYVCNPIAVKIIKKSAQVGGPGGGPSGTTTTPTCESNNSGIIIAWLGCGIINGLDGLVDGATTTVNNLLEVNSSDYSNPNLKRAWSVFRGVASFALIGVALVMIIGQAVGGDN